MKLNGKSRMNEADGNDVGEVRGRGGKLWILLVVALVVGAIVGVFCFRGQGQGLREQLRALANKGARGYREEVLGPEWYVRLTEKYKLPAVRRPVTFSSHTVADEDMAVVGKAHTLRDVTLTGPEMSDAGLAHLADLRKLQELVLYGDKIGDAGLSHLSELTELRLLYLLRTKVSDAGLVHLKKLKNLQSLLFDAGTPVTDAGLVHLKSLKGLRYLGLWGTRVTAEGVADLKLSIPNVKVDFKQSTVNPILPPGATDSEDLK